VTRDLVHSDAELDEPGDSYHSEENPKRPHKGDDDDDDDEVDSNRPNVPPPSQGKARKPPAWVDLDDANLQVSLASDKRRRKLRDSLLDDAVGGREYERRLRRQFQRINPVPDWASNVRQKLHPKRRRPSTSSASRSEHDDAEENDVAGLISSTTGILGAAKKSSVLAQGTLRIERLRDANQSAGADGSIKTVQFHPSPHVPVLLTASSDRRLSLFNVRVILLIFTACLILRSQIDGHTNPHLQTLHIPTLPLTNAVFHPTGSSVLLTGPRPFYYTYDLQSGATHRSPRGLWGTTFNRSNPSSQDLSLDTCAFNPTGDILAVAGRRGHVHLVDWNSGAGQVIAGLKMNASVKSLWWSKSNNARQGNELLTLGENAEVYVWDVGERRCIRRWRGIRQPCRER
jgi:U3 small nucleolar RNA-associated protein 18